MTDSTGNNERIKLPGDLRFFGQFIYLIFVDVVKSFVKLWRNTIRIFYNTENFRRG